MLRSNGSEESHCNGSDSEEASDQRGLGLASRSRQTRMDQRSRRGPPTGYPGRLRPGPYGPKLGCWRVPSPGTTRTAAGHVMATTPQDGGKLVMATICPGVASASGSWGHSADYRNWVGPALGCGHVPSPGTTRTAPGHAMATTCSGCIRLRVTGARWSAWQGQEMEDGRPPSWSKTKSTARRC